MLGSKVKVAQVETGSYLADVVRIEGDVVAVVSSSGSNAAFLEGAAEVVGPCAVDGELDLTLKAVGYILEGDFPNVLGNLSHLVHFSAGLPCLAVEPEAFAVTGSVNALVNKLGDKFNDVALNIGVVLDSVIHYGEGACACQVEGHVVAVLVADPLCAVLDGLELYRIVRLVNGVLLGVVAVGILGHGVGFVGAVPAGAEDFSLAACYDVDIGCFAAFCKCGYRSKACQA